MISAQKFIDTLSEAVRDEDTGTFIACFNSINVKDLTDYIKSEITYIVAGSFNQVTLIDYYHDTLKLSMYNLLIEAIKQNVVDNINYIINIKGTQSWHKFLTDTSDYNDELISNIFVEIFKINNEHEALHKSLLEDLPNNYKFDTTASDTIASTLLVKKKFADKFLRISQYINVSCPYEMLRNYLITCIDGIIIDSRITNYFMNFANNTNRFANINDLFYTTLVLERNYLTDYLWKKLITVDYNTAMLSAIVGNNIYWRDKFLDIVTYKYFVNLDWSKIFENYLKITESSKFYQLNWILEKVDKYKKIKLRELHKLSEEELMKVLEYFPYEVSREAVWHKENKKLFDNNSEYILCRFGKKEIN